MLASVFVLASGKSLELGRPFHCAATAPRKLQRSVRASPQRTESTRAATLHYAADAARKNRNASKAIRARAERHAAVAPGFTLNI